MICLTFRKEKAYNEKSSIIKVARNYISNSRFTRTSYIINLENILSIRVTTFALFDKFHINLFSSSFKIERFTYIKRRILYLK
jgi:hypothetical protein